MGCPTRGPVKTNVEPSHGQDLLHALFRMLAKPGNARSPELVHGVGTLDQRRHTFARPDLNSLLFAQDPVAERGSVVVELETFEVRLVRPSDEMNLGVDRQPAERHD